MHRLLCFLIALAAIGLSRPAAGEMSPAELLADLEARLLQASAVEIQFQLSSVGAYPTNFVGELRAHGPDRVELSSEGSFAGDDMTLHLSGIEGRAEGGREGQPGFDVASPELWESLFLGMTRMGLLHNHAKFSAASPPDHADTGVGDWLLTREHAWSDRRGELSEASSCIAFAIDVEGTYSADALLWFDEDSLPLRREQTVYFEGGSMTVVEDYHVEIVDPQRTCPPCRQTIADFGRSLYVEEGYSRIYACCSGCATKIANNWDGYLEILHELGEDTRRLHTSVDGPRVEQPADAALCLGCAGGLCEIPEHLPRN